MDEELRHIIEGAWAEWVRAGRAYPKYVQGESAPVLWFGNLEAFLKSPRRVLTIGVNPGPNTFPSGSPWDHYEGQGISRDPQRYVAAMAKFQLQDNPWFNRWNGLLEPLDACYGPGATNSAIHLDLSPIATTVGFAYLPDEVRRDLLARGLDLLSRLLAYLTRGATDPVCFLSVRQDYADFVWRGLGLHEGIPWQLGPHSGTRARWNFPGELLRLRKTGASPVSPGRADQRLLGAWMAGLREAPAPHREWEPAAQRRRPAKAVRIENSERKPAERAVTTFVAGGSDYVQLVKKHGSRHDFSPADWLLGDSNEFGQQAVSLSVEVTASSVELKVFLHTKKLGAKAEELVVLLQKAGFPIHGQNQPHPWFWPSAEPNLKIQEPVSEGATDAELATALDELVQNFEGNRAVIEQCLLEAGVL